MAGALVSAGVEQVARGVPVARVIEGLRVGLKRPWRLCASRRARYPAWMTGCSPGGADSGRSHEDIADLVVQAAVMIGEEKLKDRTFKFSDTIVAEEGLRMRSLWASLLTGTGKPPDAR